MKLKVIIEEESYSLPIDPDFLNQAVSFFDSMDNDMNKGWQMGRDWIEHPTPHQRLLIVADKLYSALENRDKKLTMMMAGYILSRAPHVTSIEMDVTGEMGHDFRENENQPTSPAAGTSVREQLNKMEAMQQASNAKPRKWSMGRISSYRF